MEFKHLTKKKIIALVIFTGVICLGVIIIGAYTRTGCFIQVEKKLLRI